MPKVDKMDNGACNVIYVDRRANDEHVRRETLSESLVARTSTGNVSQSYFDFGKVPPPDVHSNVESILSVFTEVHICGSGSSCLSKISQLLQSNQGNLPTVVLIDIPYDEERRLKRLSREPRTPSPTFARIMRVDTGEPDDLYGMHLLTHVASEISSKNFPKLVVPIVILSGLDRDLSSNNNATAASSAPNVNGAKPFTDTVRLVRYLDAGAMDVLSSPLSKDSVPSIAIHAYRAQREVAREEATFLITKKNRKLSWVGIEDVKPYAYLREAMVSSLMNGICNPEMVGDSLRSTDFYVKPERTTAISAAIGTWGFSAHDFTDDELLFGALLMLKHALKMPELEQWNMSEDELIIFLVASRTAYNDFVLYHNFRHVVDVLQALFHFLVQIGTLPPYPGTASENPCTSPVAQLLQPFDALTLLISAIGHDVGHPGVNNAFLVALNAPLAQLYNDRSVLESFHCAAYSQILRRYWPKAFSNSAMRKLMINSILATDMGLHFRYMSDLGNLQEKIAHDKGVTDAWSVKIREEYKDLACGLLIKCADISNVARKFNTAAQWANILTDEFSNQGVMEEELSIPSCLFGGPPVRDDIIKLGESQIGFMNIFARPLFEAVADILPAMRFAVDEILTNKSIWDQKIVDERQKKRKGPNLSLGLLTPSFAIDPTPSPFSGGPAQPTGEIMPPPVAQPPTNRTIQSPTALPPLDDAAGRRGSGGSFNLALSSSRRSSLGMEKGSRRSSGAGLPGARTLSSRENQSSSRRGSGDASLTAILVSEVPSKEPTPALEERTKSPNSRKDTLTKSSSPKKEPTDARPLTAPSQAKHSQGKELSAHMPPLPRPLSVGPDFESATNPFPVRHASPQSHSEVDLSHSANGNLDGSKLQQWDSSKLSGDSTISRSDASRDSSRRSEWWRQMSSRRRTRDMRNGDADTRGQHKQTNLDSTISNSTSETISPIYPSPGRNSRTGKIKSFFKRKPKNHDEQEKQLSSFGSSSQFQTPPTSDPGRSVNSDD